MSKLAIYALIAAALVGIGWKAVNSIKDSGREEIRAEWKLDNERLAKESREAVDKIKEAAEQQRKQDKSERDTAEQTERESQQKRAEKDHAIIASLDRRYKDALVKDKSCADQMQEIVLCPLE